MTTNRYLSHENKALPATLVPEPENEVKSGDLLFSRKNTFELVGACAFVFQTRARLMMPDLIFRFRFNDDACLNPLFLWGLLTDRSMRPAIQALAGGSAGSMPNISKGRLERLAIPKPPVEHQERFAAGVQRAYLNEVKTAEAQMKMKILFQTMLHRAFTGDLTAGWRAAHMKELLTEMELQCIALNRLQVAA